MLTGQITAANIVATSEIVFNFPFEVEHIRPISKQGAESLNNLALSCRSCNLRKSNRINGVDPDTGAEARLFHPRQDQWDNHFQVDVTSGRIIGATAVGRATIDCLSINTQQQIMARQLWIRLGLFP
ncbi:hypothetical protein NIES4071_07600 [Calothrix sp. NIES-4071]|nr:hypothetical protein NIES4071_07600 [Calothrix sp. NIES-4071]BAZ55102.1 hypothetical protein NIES4105_07560 [Calothrix sp. NIES-4105]